MGIIMYKDTPYGVNNPDFLAPTPSIYSEDEEQCGIWVDGKPLYRRALVFTNPTLGRVDNLAHNIPNVDRIFIEDWEYATPTGYAVVGFEGTDSNYWANIFNINRTTVSYRIGNGWSLGNTAQLIINVRYTKTTDTAYQGGFKAYGFTPVIYSDDEREIGVWRDSKPLYQKVVNYGALPNASSSVNKAHNIANVDNIFIAGGYFVETSGSDKYYYPLVLASGSNEYNIYTRVDNTNIRISVNRDRSSMAAIVVVQYTKTTDTAGSGKYTTLGAPAVHYSSDEQVIGTWVDGKTLYQKTISCGALPAATDKRVAHGISNLDYVVEAKGWAQAPGVNYTSVMFPNNSTTQQVTLIIDPSDIILRDMADRSNYTKTYVTIQYTKTT